MVLPNIMPIVRSYSSAFCSVINGDDCTSDLRSLRDLCKEDNGDFRLLCGEFCTRADRNAWVDSLEYNDVMKRFLHLVIEHNRLALLPNILDEILSRLGGVLRVLLKSAKPYTSSDKDKIRGSLIDLWHSDIEIDYVCDQSLGAGSQIFWDCNMVDCSEKGYRDRIYRHLMENAEKTL